MSFGGRLQVKIYYNAETFTNFHQNLPKIKYLMAYQTNRFTYWSGKAKEDGKGTTDTVSAR